MTRRSLLAWWLIAGSLLAQAPGKGLVIVLIGPPNSGKSTQAEFLKKRYKIPVISVDRMTGSDDSVNAEVKKRVAVANAAKGFVLDGYPASHGQADALAKLVQELHLPAPVVVQIDISDQVARAREAKKPKPESTHVDRELKDYHADLEFYRSYYPQADVWTINGDRDPAAVSATIESLIQDRR
jgi:adenylate kinase family enzyme